MINLELAEKHQETYNNLRMVAEHMMRPYSRKYDREEHSYPQEMEEVAKLLGGGAAAAAGGSNDKEGGVRNGANLMAVSAYEALCWGDVGLMLSMPGRGLGNAAINAVGTPEQIAEHGKSYAAMCITEPGTGSDSANISTTAVLDGDEWIINGEKIYVTAGGRCDTLVVWATLDKAAGKAAIKSFIVKKGTPGCEVTRLEHKMGIRASDTAAISFSDCRIPKANLLGSATVATDAEGRKKAFGGVMQTFDNTRPPVAAMALGAGRAALDLCRESLAREGVELTFDKKPDNASAVHAELYLMVAEWNGAKLVGQKASGMADNCQLPSAMAVVGISWPLSSVTAKLLTKVDQRLGS